jgi:hypothetical protein
MREQIKRAGGGADLGGGNAQIAGGGSQAAMAEQELDSTDVGAQLEKVNGKCYAQPEIGQRLAGLADHSPRTIMVWTGPRALARYGKMGRTRADGRDLSW